MNYRMIKYTVGWLMLFEAGFFSIPLLTAAIYGESAFYAFLLSMGICAAVALAFLFIGKPKSYTLYAKDGFVIVSLGWIFLSIFGALPFMFSGVTDSYIDALFETVSGFTTTGSSIFSSVEALPMSINMWRCFTHWIGGMGVLVFIMAFLPLSGAQNLHIMRAESPGPSVNKLVPRMRNTALILYLIYAILTVIQFIFLICGGMSVYEAICTSFATAGTGGFGIKNDSLGSYSPYLQIVVTVFMLLFSLNFNAYYLIIKGKLKDALNSEIRSFVCIVAIVITVITLNVYPMFSSVGEAIRHSSFTVASLISTTGFVTTDFDLWPSLSKLLLLIIMFIGACAGSTGGGLKVSRMQILLKGAKQEVGNLLHPRRVKKVQIDGRPLETEVIRTVNAYFAIYVIVFFASMIIISFDNHDFLTTFSAVSAALNNIGPGLGDVGPTCNFSFFSVPSKLVLIFNMLAGRLELFPMLILFAPSTWKNR